MTEKKKDGSAEDTIKSPKVGGSCFAIMPISDHQDYPADHFGEVYESIIQPAVRACGYEPVRADQVAATNLIHLDILKHILEAPIAICDLSSANPNVMFELGLRQAFDKPVVLIKDDRTRKIFDIDNIRTIQYDAEMRPRAVRKAIEAIAASIIQTVAAKPEDGVNSIVGLIGLHAAALKHTQDDPDDARMALLERQLNGVSSKLDQLNVAYAKISDMAVAAGRAYAAPTLSGNRLLELS